MNLVYERCCGLDIHQKTIAACRITPGPDGTAQKEIKSFQTMTDDVLALGKWLSEGGVTHVAMESTGIYWQPIYNLLEDQFTLLLVNARHVKAVPGRKTDIRDCEWLADLLQHGLLKASFVPNREQRELRQLTRYRTTLADTRSAEVKRLQKTLEASNIKLRSVASDILGKSGREMLNELSNGTTDAAKLANLAKGTLRNKIPELQRALDGRFGAHQRFMVAEHLAQIDALEAQIERFDQEVATRTEPFKEELAKLDQMPGFGIRAAENVVAEIGVDMTRFPTAHHLASWARLCPGSNESAGKQRSAPTGRGNPWLRRTLVQTAHAAGHTKSYFGAQYRRLRRRRGAQKATIAVSHSQLVTVYHLLRVPGAHFTDLGPDYFDEHDRTALEHRHVNALEKLGYNVQLQPRAA